MLVEIGQNYGKTAAQTVLRFLIQSDVVVIPKSTHKERMEQNLDVFDFALSDAEMDAIRALDEGKSLFFDHYDPRHGGDAHKYGKDENCIRRKER